MITIIVDRKNIGISAQNKEIKFTIASGSIYYSTGLTNSYQYTLSQVDIDNKYIIISQLSTVADKSKIIVLIENASFIAEYLTDYIIDSEGKISWAGLDLENKLMIGDKIKVYYYKEEITWQ
jgi:hypothetical protein